MFSTLLVDRESQSVATLEQHLSSYCPKIEVKAVAFSRENASKLIQDLRPEIVFMDIDVVKNAKSSIFNQTFRDFETIIMCPESELTSHYNESQANGYLTKPFQVGELINTVRNVQQKLEIKQLQLDCKKLLYKLAQHTPPHNMIAISTIEGMEFLQIDQIIRCEGLQRYTRVVTTEKADIISSYNIGEFCKLFQTCGFFSTHKSHLVNLIHIKRLNPDGTLLMKDGFHVPVSRRRKTAFFNQIRHI